MVYRATAFLTVFVIICAAVQLMLRWQIVSAPEADAVFFGALAVTIIMIVWILPQRSENSITTVSSSEVLSSGNTNAF